MNTKKKVLSLGEFLKVHRLGEGLSQVDLAAELGISKQRLCDLEHNRGNVSIKFCKSLAKKLKLPPEWIVKLALEHQLKEENIDLNVG
ncbi:MAG: helix-turn-helix transcriptional regulator [Bdellovibrionaceae bacterium]|nr:helix-turn-helix transcriptional regulator [Pseudobdellovibrionaceae bacterium]